MHSLEFSLMHLICSMNSCMLCTWCVECPTPSVWKIHVDDTFVIEDTEHKDKFLQYINSINNVIKYTVEDTRPDRAMPFLDTI